MSLLVETIRVLNGRVYNIDRHNDRFNQTRQKLFNTTTQINLRSLIKVPISYRKGLVKCRILYDQSLRRIEFHHYKPKSITSLKCVYSDLDYQFKWVERKELDQLFLQKALCDDILIIKDQKVTDTYYANTAFYQDGRWFTPKKPLLKGSQRSKLIQNSRLIEKDIFLSDLVNFTKVAVFNAMRPFGELILPINAIIRS